MKRQKGLDFVPRGILAWLGLFAAAGAFAQLPPAAQVVPPDFKVTVERNLGGAIMIEATKPNAGFPKAHMDQGIRLGVSWMPNPMAATTVDMLAKQPEDPAGQSMGVTRSEPAGKQRYRGGVLTWRKITTPWVGSGDAPDLVTWDGSWVGAGSGGLIGVSVGFFVGSKEAALALIDGVLDKIKVAR
jgi:hypothetical protein